MFNKNDPLISAVQEVMKRNHAEREAAKVVNEKFGIYDRKALPHEKQGEWDAAYKQVLAEGVEALDEKKLVGKQPNIDVASSTGEKKPDGKLTKHDFEHLRSMKEEEQLDELKGYRGKEGQKLLLKVRKRATNRLIKATDPIWTSKSGMSDKDKKNAKRNSDVARMADDRMNEEQLEEKKMTDAEMAKREEIVKSMKKGASGFKKRYGKRAKDVMYATATKQAMKEDNEGFNNRHSLSVTASAKKQAVADQLNEKIGNPLLLNRAKARARIGDSGVGKPISGINNLQTRLAKLRKSAPALDPNRNIALDNPTTQSNMALAQNPNIGGAGGGNYAAAQTRIPMAQKRAATGDIPPAKNTARQDNDFNAMRVASRDTNQDRPASAKYNSAKQMAPSVSQDALAKMRKDREATKSGPSFEKTGRGNAPSVSNTGTKAQTDLKPANVMSAKPSFEFSDKQREAAKAGKASIKDVESWAKSRGIKANPGSKEILRNYLNAAQNKTMKTDVKAGGTAATPTQTSAQSAEMKFKAGMAQRSGPSAPVKQTASPSPKPSASTERANFAGPPASPSPAPNVQPARNSTLAAPSATAATTMATATKAAGQMAVDRMKAQNLAKSQTSSMSGGSVNTASKPKPATSSLTRRVGPDGQGGLTVGQNKPAMGMSFTPKTTIDAAKKSVSSVTPQMSQSVNSLQQKASMAGKERGLAPDFAKRELTRRQNIQTVKGA